MPEDRMHVDHIITSDYNNAKRKTPTSAQEEQFKSLLNEEESSPKKRPINLPPERLLGLSALFFDNIEIDISNIKPLILRLDHTFFNKEQLDLIEEKINHIIVNNQLAGAVLEPTLNKDNQTIANPYHLKMPYLITEATKNYSQMEILGEEFNRFVDIIGQQIHSGFLSYKIEDTGEKKRKIFYLSSVLTRNENIKIWSYVIVFLLIFIILYFIVFKI